MTQKAISVVTGALGYTGRAIAAKLLESEPSIRTLTNHGNRAHPFGDRLQIEPLDFSKPDQLTESLRGAGTLYVTYWIRFPHGGLTFEHAVQNSGVLIRAAKEAGVRRLVQISITKPTLDSPLPYFSGKARVEDLVRQSGIPHTILRPTVVFGEGDILINNIAWMLRKFPLFALPDAGECRIQPIFVEDLAELAVQAGSYENSIEHEIKDAVGPETYSYEELVRLIAKSLDSRSRLFRVKPRTALKLSRLLSYFVRDVVLTEDELEGLSSNLLVSDDPPTGRTSFRDWLRENSDQVGTRYASELARHYR